MPPDPGSCLAAGFLPCPQRSVMMSPPPSASPKLHNLSSAPHSKGMASPSLSPLGLQRPAGGVLAGQEAPRPVGTHPGSPQRPPPPLLPPQVSPQLSSSCSPGRQPAVCPNSPSSPLPSGTQELTCLQSCSPTRPPGMGHQQHQLPKVPEKESAAAGPLPLPEAREDSNHSLAPIPVSVKREPQDLDQLYLDDGKCPRPQVRSAWRRVECATEGYASSARRRRAPCGVCRGRRLLLLAAPAQWAVSAPRRVALSAPSPRPPVPAGACDCRPSGNIVLATPAKTSGCPGVWARPH